MSDITNALHTLRQGKWIDLTHEVHSNIPKYGAFPDLALETPYTIEKDGFFVHRASFVTQYGTHIDAPIHFSQHGRTLSQLELQEFFLPLYVIHKEQEVANNPNYTLSVDDVLAFEAQHGPIEKESFVAFASGWSKRWEGDFANKDANGQAHTPGWSIEALDFLINKRNVRAIGHETMDTDASIDVAKSGFLYAEKFVLDNDRFQIELMTNLDKLPPVGAVIIIGVPKFRAFPGFPVRAFAITPTA